MNNQLILNNMKTTIQFHQASAARDHENSAVVPMLQDSAINHLELSLGMSSCSSSGIAHKHNKNAPTTSTRKRMISFQTEELDVSPPAYKKSASVSSRLAFDYGYLFAHCPTGFVDPWSLAARQQKAAVEQAHFKNHPSSNIAMKPQQASVIVGWPPICSSRKNLISQTSTKSSTSDEKNPTLTNEKRTETNKDAAICRLELIRPTLYVKVNMEGFSVGRKIDLSSFDSYESLSQALQQMFSNFLSNKLITKDGINGGDDSEFILLYEDHEGDKILVGDVPWELFLTSVKRLYIARQSSAQDKASKESKDTNKEAAAT